MDHDRIARSPQASDSPERVQDAAPMTRRGWLGAMGLVAGGAALKPTIAGAFEAEVGPSSTDGELIVRSRRPLNLESAPASLDHRLTPNDAFFVRSHFGAPAVDLAPWEIEVVGLVDRPSRWAIDALGRLEQVTTTAVLQCAGNGRGLYRPRVPGTPWERGAVGQAEWAGVRLAELLDRAGVQAGAAHLHFHGGDAPPSPKIPAFVRSLPIDRAREPSTLLALRMNGEPLPTLHGGPLRLVVPGWAGNNWTKWVRRIVVAREESPNFYMQTGYRMPRSPIPPGAPAGSVPMDPVTWMNVKSLITSPGRGATVPKGNVEIRGIAWTGQGHVEKVEVRIDEDGWRVASLIDPAIPGAWRRWRMEWTPSRRGRHVVAARATDSMGQVQPETPPWNKSGYLWNGIEAVAFEVG